MLLLLRRDRRTLRSYVEVVSSEELLDTISSEKESVLSHHIFIFLPVLLSH